MCLTTVLVAFYGGKVHIFKLIMLVVSEFGWTIGSFEVYDVEV